MSKATPALLLGLLAAASCGRDVTFVDPRAATDPADSTDDDSTIVVRGNLAVTVSIAPGDSAIARALGLPGLALPGASVTARRLGQPLREGLTDSAGQVTFEALVTGPWTVSVLRVLTAEERAALPTGAEDVAGFAGAAGVAVVEGGSTVSITAAVGRAGSVVISEVFGATPRMASGDDYFTAHFVEVLNNGLETAYLDGMILGFSYHALWASNVGTCDDTRRWREDSLGIWARFFGSFPGTGRSYPLLPGATAVIATDGVDHSQFDSRLPNLSGADFEFIGSADVDNPSVPNMLNTGLAEPFSVIGHGLRFTVSAIYLFVATPLDLGTLVSDIAIPDWKHVRIPRDAVLDVFTTRRTPELEAASALVPCARITDPVFDQQNAYLFDYTQLTGMRRKLLEIVGDRVILQRTRNSAADFETATPTPGRVQ